MITRLQTTYRSYPRQFWLMFIGMLFSTIGSSLIWPFLMIYVTKTLHTSLTVTAGLLSIQSAAGLVASLLGGPLIDRLGRKNLMAFSLVANGLSYLFMSQAHSLGQFAVLMGLAGAVNPIYRAAADTMVADMIEPHRRTDAYSLLRMSNNLGITMGPVIGGTLAATSYTLAFVGAALGMGAYGLMIAFLAYETLPIDQKKLDFSKPGEVLCEIFDSLKGYLAILLDWHFMRFAFNFALITVTTVMIWTLMPVYANQHYGVPENVYKWIPVTNALMVVLLQAVVTQFTKRHSPVLMMAAGGVFYTLAVGGVSLAHSFQGFWLVMVVMTIGEMILAPTSSTYAANLAPLEKRGRYIGMFSLTWPVAAMIGPVYGGLLSDHINPQASWVGGFVVGLVAVVLFVVFHFTRVPAREVSDLSPAA